MIHVRCDGSFQNVNKSVDFSKVFTAVIVQINDVTEAIDRYVLIADFFLQFFNYAAVYGLEVFPAVIIAIQQAVTLTYIYQSSVSIHVVRSSAETVKSLFPAVISSYFRKCIEEFAGKDNCELLINTKDVWARDYMPIQLTKEDYLGYTYKPDYLDSGSGYEKCVTNWRLHNVHAEKFNLNKIKCVQMPLVLDGGNVVKAVLNDKPCMIMCEKVLKENNVDSKNGTEVDGFRNWWKEWWKENFDGTEMELVLLPWEGRELNPIGHADGMVRYIGNNSVLMTNYKDFDKSYEDY